MAPDLPFLTRGLFSCPGHPGVTVTQAQVIFPFQPHGFPGASYDNIVTQVDSLCHQLIYYSEPSFKSASMNKTFPMIMGSWVTLSDLLIVKALCIQDHLKGIKRVGTSGTQTSQVTHSVIKISCRVAPVTMCVEIFDSLRKNSISQVRRMSDCIKFSLDALTIIVCSYAYKMAQLEVPAASLLPCGSFYTRINLEVK